MNHAPLILALLALTALAVGLAGLIAARALAREALRWLEIDWWPR